MSHIITISGEPCTGTTTISKLLEKQNYTRVSTGDFARELSEKLGFFCLLKNV